MKKIILLFSMLALCCSTISTIYAQETNVSTSDDYIIYEEEKSYYLDEDLEEFKEVKESSLSRSSSLFEITCKFTYYSMPGGTIDVSIQTTAKNVRHK